MNSETSVGIKKGKWLVMVGVLTVILMLLISYVYWIKENKKQNRFGGDIRSENVRACNVDDDCTVGIQATECCGCPEAVNKKVIGEGDWEIYAERVDYSPRRVKSCGGPVVCKPCENPLVPSCEDGVCRFRTVDR
ncbi:MAG: hypothetical protein ACD_27C00050G0001 [uncultured bacterium]|nr:MAG: hypothetical protein ACD_27C00050G0001 [uncultured bacterium]